MGGQDDDTVLLLGLEHLPEASPGSQVHAGGGLVEKHKFGTTNECYSHREFTLVATAEVLGLSFSLSVNIDGLEHGLDLFFLGLLVNTLEFTEDIEVLFRSELLKEHVVLGANSHELTDDTHVSKEVVAKDVGLAMGALK